MQKIREIKFRGQKEHSREWVYGNLIQFDWADFIVKYGSFEERCRVIPETVGEYTGLKDKNGKEIYQSDILSIQDPYTQNWTKDGAIVKFSNDYVGGWVVSDGKHNLNLGTRQKHLKVIGNIFEHPELTCDHDFVTKFGVDECQNCGMTFEEYSKKEK